MENDRITALTDAISSLEIDIQLFATGILNARVHLDEGVKYLDSGRISEGKQLIEAAIKKIDSEIDALGE